MESWRNVFSFRSCRYGMCGISCFWSRLSKPSVAVSGHRTGGSHFADLLESFFFGCDCRSFFRSGVLVSNSEYNGANFLAKLSYSRESASLLAKPAAVPTIGTEAALDLSRIYLDSNIHLNPEHRLH